MQCQISTILLRDVCTSSTKSKIKKLNEAKKVMEISERKFDKRKYTQDQGVVSLYIVV